MRPTDVQPPDADVQPPDVQEHCLSCQRSALSVNRVRLIDADTLDLPDVGRVRLAGIDAPENGQPARDARGHRFDAGQAATAAFADYLYRRQGEGWQVHFAETEKARGGYGRILARVILKRGRKREDACAWLVRHGWAVAEYGPPHYRREESRARRERAGLWAGEWQRPRIWRAGRKGASARPAFRGRRPSGRGWLTLFRLIFRLFRMLR
ncbi:MAG: thermonuclease family protein [Rhodobacteraceae bacterium]|nr:thermonuclease family protein [Paracoccaceae bacterium]